MVSSMVDTKLMPTIEQSLDIKYEILVSDEEIAGKVNDEEIFFSAEEFPKLADDFINIEFDDNVDKADKKDYLLAAACGVLTGSLSVLWELIKLMIWLCQSQKPWAIKKRM